MHTSVKGLVGLAMSVATVVVPTTLATTALLGVSVQSASAASLDVGTQQSIFTGNTRGYWFTAPTDFTITGLRAPVEVGSGNQYIEVLKFNSPPPIFSNVTNDFTSLAYFAGVPGTSFIPTNIPVLSGTIIGILGGRNVSNNIANSYTSSPYASSINGFAVSLQRLGFQASLVSTQANNLFTENGGSIARIELDYTPGVAKPVPVPPAVMGLVVGAGMLGRKFASSKRKATKAS